MATSLDIFSPIIWKHLQLIQQSEVTTERLQEIHASGIFADLLKAPHLDRGAARKAFGFEQKDAIIRLSAYSALINESEGREALLNSTLSLPPLPRTGNARPVEYCRIKLLERMSLWEMEGALAKHQLRLPTPYELLGGMIKSRAVTHANNAYRKHGWIHFVGTIILINGRFTVELKNQNILLHRDENLILETGQYLAVNR